MKDGITPIRQQYLRIKHKYPEAIVFFRLGDFYETFDEDAQLASRELEIVLTAREMGKGQRIPMAGIPYHAVDNYLARLINRGYKVAICEQVTRPGETKGLVQREVVRLVTPGTVVEPGLLDSKVNNYLVSIVPGDGEYGIAYADITTSEFATVQVPEKQLAAELGRLKPSEIITAKETDLSVFNLMVPVTQLDSYPFDLEVARQKLLDHFGVTTLEGYGCEHLPLAVRAAGAVIHYIGETQKTALGQLTQLSTYTISNFMALDPQTIRNLEIFQNSRTGTASGSLLAVIDLTKTAVGGRLLRRWLGQPLLDLEELKQRQNSIGWFVANTLARTQTMSLLGDVADIERLINRVRTNIVSPRELVALRRSLETVPRLKEALGETPDISRLRDELKPRPDVIELISQAIADQPPVGLDEGNVIKTGFSEELDRLRLTATNSRQYLANLEQKERQRAGIKSLRVSYNRVFGYFIEISNANLSQVPNDYIRKQTLVNGERFFTPELKEYETQILNAQERIIELEMDLFHHICQQVAAHGETIMDLANAVAHIDVLSSLAEAASRYNYIRPQLNDGKLINIKDGRHPVVERSLIEGNFVANDTFLSNDENQIIMLTGPNMSGKSTFLRQVALIVLLAQTGSFVPALSASIGLVDRIFTRIGAREDLASGQSTFMVEMTETANILNNATPRSLIILDEIGRGTSTYDGMSIARAVTEYIHNHPRLGTKTIFATHYHELVALAGVLPRVKNYNVAVAEEGGNVIFLHKILPGGVDKSYGIHVAKLAGLPKTVIHRANEVLAELESGSEIPAKRVTKKAAAAQQLPLLTLKSPVLEELEKLEIDSLTPLEALTKLYELQKSTREQASG